MPLFVKDSIDNVDFAVWKVEESYEQLVGILGDENVVREVRYIKSDKRRLEIVASRYLFKYLCGDAYETIVHDENGRPYIKSGSRKISISHTGNYVAVAVSTFDVGIDIETITGRAYRLKSRFLSDTEIGNIDNNNFEVDAVVRWSAKESVYKVVGREVYDFKDTLSTGRFSVSEDDSLEVCTGCNCKSENELFNVFFRIYDDFVLTLCFK